MTIEVHFERIGIHHDIRRELDVEPEDPTFLRLVIQIGRSHLFSNEPGYLITADDDDMRAGSIAIEGGRFGRGRWRVLEEAST